jgi:hypothetical protein
MPPTSRRETTSDSSQLTNLCGIRTMRPGYSSRSRTARTTFSPCLSRSAPALFPCRPAREATPRPNHFVRPVGSGRMSSMADPMYSRMSVSSRIVCLCGTLWSLANWSIAILIVFSSSSCVVIIRVLATLTAPCRPFLASARREDDASSTAEHHAKRGHNPKKWVRNREASTLDLGSSGIDKDVRRRLAMRPPMPAWR